MTTSLGAIFLEVIRAVIGFFVVATLIKNYLFLILAPFYPIRERLRYIRSVKRRRARTGRPYLPKISIIVPAWNEEVGVIRTAKSILENGYSNIELIIVNDGSTDNSDKIIKDYIKSIKSQYPDKKPPINYISQPNGGKGVALNTGIGAATGEIIMTVDADSILQEGGLAKLTRYYLDDSIMAVVGNVEVLNARSIPGLAQQLEYYFGFYNKRAHALMGAEYIYGGACASFRKTVFDEIGLFDTENKTEDIEMSMRTRFHGMASTYAEDVICYTEGASDMHGLVNQRIRWKKGRLDTFIKYKSMFFSTDERHNLFLCFFVLPFSVLAELQLVFEPVAIGILIAYSIVTTEYLSLSIGLLFILLVFVVVPVFHGTRPRPKFILYFPFVWPLFYLLDWVEFVSLYKSVKMIRQGKDVEWQRWKRQGI